MSIVTNVLMDRGEASRRRIPQPCIKAVEQWARCKEDACEILDQCDGMRGYLTPDIVVAVTSRYYSQRQVDRARSVAMDYLTRGLVAQGANERRHKGVARALRGEWWANQLHKARTSRQRAWLVVLCEIR